MRTNERLKKSSCLPLWLQLLLISRKHKLSAYEAALYLRTTVKNLYQWVCYYYLPSHKTHKNRLYFIRKEINTWLKVRHRKDFPKTLKKKRSKTKNLNNGLQ